jgi:hypothetical protein
VRTYETVIGVTRYRSAIESATTGAPRRALGAIGVDAIQFDEPAVNVYMKDVRNWDGLVQERR